VDILSQIVAEKTGQTGRACKKCGEIKPACEFSKDPRGFAGLNSRCKACVCVHSRMYREQNREKVLAKAKAKRDANPELYRQQKRDARLRRIYQANSTKSITARTPEENAEFDRQVAALRGKVTPRNANKIKAECTPEEWAANRDYAKSIYGEHRESVRAKVRSMYAANPEKFLAANKEYRIRNPQKVRETAGRWSIENPEKAKAAQRARYLRNREKVRAAAKAWCEANRDRHRSRVRKYQKARRSGDCGPKLRDNLRSRLYQAMRNNQKAGSAVRDLGCTIDALKSHIESQFTAGMSWETWGTSFEIDHIFPLVAANLEDRTEFLAVNNWRNLQPLTPDENNAKKDKVTPAARRLFDALVAEFSQQAVA